MKSLCHHRGRCLESRNLPRAPHEVGRLLLKLLHLVRNRSVDPSRKSSMVDAKVQERCVHHIVFKEVVDFVKVSGLEAFKPITLKSHQVLEARRKYLLIPQGLLRGTKTSSTRSRTPSRTSCTVCQSLGLHQLSKQISSSFRKGLLFGKAL